MTVCFVAVVIVAAVLGAIGVVLSCAGMAVTLGLYAVHDGVI